MSGFDCLNASAGDASNLGHRAQHITEAVNNKVSKFRTRPPTLDEWLLDSKAECLRDIPFEDFDATQAALAKHLKKNGCCEVIVRGERLRLSDLLVQMESAAELLAPYRPLLRGAR